MLTVENGKEWNPHSHKVVGSASSRNHHSNLNAAPNKSMLWQRGLIIRSRCNVASPFRYMSDSKGKQGNHAPDGASKQLNQILAALDAPVRKEPPISAEETERRYQIGRNYVIGCFEQHNDLNHDLACKLQLKRHALKMLPKEGRLREEALKIDMSVPPLWRNLPVWTPPIPDFDPSQFVDHDNED